MAPNAQLLFLDIGNDTSGCLSITDLTGTLQQGYGGGARIHSASWGAPTGGIYSGNDFEADFALSKAEDMIFVVSAGNEGTSRQPDHGFAGQLEERDHGRRTRPWRLRFGRELQAAAARPRMAVANPT